MRLAAFADRSLNHKRLLRSLLVIYRNTGVIRTLHMLKHSALEFECPNAELLRFKEYKSKIQIEKKYCTNPQTSIHRIKIIQTACLNKLPEIKQREINAFIKKNVKQLGKSLKNNPDESEWHDLRKKLKLILYTSVLLKQKSRKMIRLLKEVNKLQDEIGNWHDLKIFHDFLIQHQHQIKPGNALRHKIKNKLNEEYPMLIKGRFNTLKQTTSVL